MQLGDQLILNAILSCFQLNLLRQACLPSTECTGSASLTSQLALKTVSWVLGLQEDMGILVFTMQGLYTLSQLLSPQPCLLKASVVPVCSAILHCYPFRFTSHWGLHNTRGCCIYAAFTYRFLPVCHLYLDARNCPFCDASPAWTLPVGSLCRQDIIPWRFWVQCLGLNHSQLHFFLLFFFFFCPE